MIEPALCRVDGFNRADISTGPAIRTNIGIDFVDIPFRNGLNRAFINAGATGGTFICNYVCHCIVFLVKELS